MTRLLSNTAYAYLQKSGGRYVEPFLGGAAVALDLGLPDMILADVCEPLIHAYRQVCAHPKEVAWMLGTYARRGVDKETYMATRGDVPFSHIQRAAHFLYLNALCFNGVWRVNAAGVFNVAYGAKSDGTPGRLRNEEELVQFAATFGGSQIDVADFRTTLALAGEGDFIYADPPYLGTFDGYSADRFSLADHAALAEALRCAYDRGADLITTNMDTAEIRELYSWAAIQVTGEAQRVSCDAMTRGKMSTVLISTIPDLVGVEV
jgi:DNA adenine methylase